MTYAAKPRENSCENPGDFRNLADY